MVSLLFFAVGVYVGRKSDVILAFVKSNFVK